MEIILKQDVKHVGSKDDLVKVKNGFGSNYLLPKGFAILATESAKKPKAKQNGLKERLFKWQQKRAKTEKYLDLLPLFSWQKPSKKWVWK